MALFQTFQVICQRSSRASNSLLINNRHLYILTNPNYDDSKTKNISQVIEDLSASVIGGPTSYDPHEYNRRRQELLKYVPSSQNDLPVRRMLDSYDSAIIPLASNKLLRDRYMTHVGGVRVGRLLEDMDIFAVHLVFKHTLLPDLPENTTFSPFSIVTALVDRIFVHGKLRQDEDIKLSGHVTWVGRSSAESSLILEQKHEGVWQRVTEANFVLVARDPTNTKGAVLNKLVAETEEEKILFERGQKNTIARKECAEDSLFKNPPSENEKMLIHDFFIKTVDHAALSFKARVKPDNR